MKYNVALSFVRRVFQLSDASFRESNKNRIQQILSKNNYPSQYINKIITKALYTYKKGPNKTTNLDPENPTILASITHIEGLTDTIGKSLMKTETNLFLAKRVINTLSSSFTKLKDPTPKNKVEGVVYNIPCECGAVYIGETGKTLDIRLKQHMNDVKLVQTKIIRDEMDIDNIHGKTALVNHAIKNNHKFKFENTTVIDRETNMRRRRFKEACHIWHDKNNINYKVDTQKLHNNYTYIFNKFSTLRDKTS